MDFPGVLVLGLSVFEGCSITQFCGVSRGFSGVSMGNIKNLKIPGVGVEDSKICPQTILFVFFWNR